MYENRTENAYPQFHLNFLLQNFQGKKIYHSLCVKYYLHNHRENNLYI